MSYFGIFKSELLYNPLIKIFNIADLIDKTIEYTNYYNNERIQKKPGIKHQRQLILIQIKYYDQKKNKVYFELRSLRIEFFIIYFLW